MVEYGALLDDSFGDLLRQTWNDFVYLLAGIPLYWYGVILVLFVVIIKLLTSK